MAKSDKVKVPPSLLNHRTLLSSPPISIKLCGEDFSYLEAIVKLVTSPMALPPKSLANIFALLPVTLGEWIEELGIFVSKSVKAASIASKGLPW
jgi:hypothetical protein